MLTVSFELWPGEKSAVAEVDPEITRRLLHGI